MSVQRQPLLDGDQDEDEEDDVRNRLPTRDLRFVSQGESPEGRQYDALVGSMGFEEEGQVDRTPSGKARYLRIHIYGNVRIRLNRMAANIFLTVIAMLAGVSGLLWADCAVGVRAYSRM